MPLDIRGSRICFVEYVSVAVGRGWSKKRIRWGSPPSSKRLSTTSGAQRQQVEQCSARNARNSFTTHILPRRNVPCCVAFKVVPPPPFLGGKILPSASHFAPPCIIFFCSERAGLTSKGFRLFGLLYPIEVLLTFSSAFAPRVRGNKPPHEDETPNDPLCFVSSSGIPSASGPSLAAPCPGWPSFAPAARNFPG